jgi:hypothetical protein
MPRPDPAARRDRRQRRRRAQIGTAGLMMICSLAGGLHLLQVGTDSGIAGMSRPAVE